MTHKHHAITLVAAALLLCAATVPITAEETAMDAMSSEAFAAKVRDAGGSAEFVFGDDRPFAQCHASTIVEGGKGLLSAWFAGTEEKNPDVGIWLSRLEDGAWSAPERVAKVAEKAHWNPVLFKDQEGKIYLFFKVGVDVPHWSTWWMHSEDGGATWNTPAELVPGDVGGRGPVKNKAIVLADGSWLAPASIEEPGRRGMWRPFADRSEDRGVTWQRGEDWVIDRKQKKLKGLGAIQPAFWESAPGKVHALMRTTIGCVWRTDSDDYGKTWKPVYPTELPNNNSGLDVERVEDGRVFLVYNPIGVNWGPRTPLDLAVSEDDGATWRTIAHLEDDPDKKSEYSYPSIVRTETGLAISYTWQRQRVRAWHIPLGALK